MAGLIRSLDNALAWNKCSPGSDMAVHGPSNKGTTDKIPCSKVALARKPWSSLLPSGGESLRVGLPWPLERPAISVLGRIQFGARLRVHKPYNDQTTQRSRPFCMGTPTKGVNMVPLTAVSLRVTGGLALETKVSRYAWSSFANIAELGFLSRGLLLWLLPIEMTRPALYSKCASVKSNIPIPWEGPDSVRAYPTRSTHCSCR